MAVLTDEHVPSVFITTLRSNGHEVVHAGLVVYTDANYLRDDPEDAVRTLERVFAHYPPEELHGGLVWLDQWR
ncbi:hypothetical protein HZS55_12035 [Halosimplex rubrum]|uniref:DUF5615 family PIN-like protein n=1 Tax=Halosimplex rubrum TaxID=869889 RepID=A0A7D5P0F5_9EURY|nr:hypothetical protein [Halosimplex rubrum]QLH77983.1 hypothetical protein HZS55_12035 [Halosimplex rubrum]